jgi:nitrate/nitrite transporter NarK
VTIVAAALVIIFVREPKRVQVEPVGSVESAEPTNRINPAALVEPTNRINPAEPVEPANPTNPAAPVESSAFSASSASDAASVAKPRYRELLTRDTILFLFGFLCFSISLLAMLSYLPSVLQIKNFSVQMSAVPTSIMQTISLVSVPLYGALSDKTGRSKLLLIVTFFVFGIGVALMFLTTGAALWVTSVVQGALGFGCVGLFLVGWGKVLPRPELMSLGMGVFILVQCLGQFIGSWAIQMVLGPGLDQTLPTAIALIAVCVVGTACLAASRFK